MIQISQIKNKSEAWHFGNKMLEKCIECSPKRDLDEFLKTFSGPVCRGPHAFMDAYKHVWPSSGTPCVIVVEEQGWWCVVENGKQWVDMMKLKHETEIGN